MAVIIEGMDMPTSCIENDLIRREEAINGIEQCIRTAEEPYQLTETDKIMNHAFEIAASCVYNLPAAEPEQKWIPIHEKIPEENGSYFVWLPMGSKNHQIAIANWCGDYFDIKTFVSAWMPLPEPYKEDNKDG